MNVEDAVNYLYSIPDYDEATGIDITLEPPDDGAQSDADDPSEDIVDVEENVNLLGPRLLANAPHIQLTNRNSRVNPCSTRSTTVDLEDDDVREASPQEKAKPPKKRKSKPVYEWKQYNLDHNTYVERRKLDNKSQHIPSIVNRWADEGLTPYDIFTNMWNEEIMKLIKVETNRYHQVTFGKELHVTVNELYQVLGIFLLSGYNKVPNRRLFWSKCADTRNLSVTQCGMSVNRYEEIVRSFHFVDNSKMPSGDKLYKIKPLFDHFNKIFMELAQPLPMTWAVDEEMEPYYEHHGLKQFIRGKPVRFGFKFWCLCSSEGFLVSFKLYEGRDSGHEQELSIGESVVHTLVKGKVPLEVTGL
ncbi:piggyBac transposable element-derived protein 3-like [Portunus trituberculatus]|uniref:piggyBac transposable element-derived protein 3-like n=1 Tax=Portunus trituberculatus TaxID=210409 RepID=UPI001E1CDBB6|nr:piggyBac transposable element-derived protein 3-like [Portunus trituberculatus]